MSWRDAASRFRALSPSQDTADHSTSSRWASRATVPAVADALSELIVDADHPAYRSLSAAVPLSTDADQIRTALHTLDRDAIDDAATAFALAADCLSTPQARKHPLADPLCVTARELAYLDETISAYEPASASSPQQARRMAIRSLPRVTLLRLRTTIHTAVAGCDLLFTVTDADATTPPPATLTYADWPAVISAAAADSPVGDALADFFPPATPTATASDTDPPMTTPAATPSETTAPAGAPPSSTPTPTPPPLTTAAVHDELLTAARIAATVAHRLPAATRDSDESVPDWSFTGTSFQPATTLTQPRPTETGPGGLPTAQREAALHWPVVIATGYSVPVTEYPLTTQLLEWWTSGWRTLIGR